jgi:hypothetical protein
MTRWASGGLVFLAACGAPPSNLPPGVVLQYGVSHMGNTTSFEVKAGGAAEYTSTGGPGGKKHVRATVTEAEVGALAEVLRKNRFCSLTSGRSTGVPDEARPSIRARLADLDCTVTLWDNEWYENQKARACLHAVEAFGRTLADRGVAE